LEEEAIKIILLNQAHIKTGMGSCIEIMEYFFKKANIEYKIITLSYDNRLDEYASETYKDLIFHFMGNI